MPISHKHKAILIHIPKNAGESMEKKMGIYGAYSDPLKFLWGTHDKYVLQHLTMSQMKRLYISDDVFDSYFKFAFVRNPWDKAVSEYHWYLRYGDRITFKEWIRTLGNRLLRTSKPPVLEIGHNIPQYEYVYDGNGRLLVDFVGRFERLQEDFDTVCEIIGIENSFLPRLQTTTSKRRRYYKEYYDNQGISTIATIYKRDIELFGYEF